MKKLNQKRDAIRLARVSSYLLKVNRASESPDIKLVLEKYYARFNCTFWITGHALARKEIFSISWIDVESMNTTEPLRRMAIWNALR